MRHLQSFLAPAIIDFIRYKQALNKKYRTESFALRLFDRYLFEHDITSWGAINNTVIAQFLDSRPRVRPRSYNHLLGVTRRFMQWAALQQLTCTMTIDITPKRDTGQRIPFIFNLTTAKRLLYLASQLPDQPKGLYRGRTYETMFALLFGLGLRAGEVCRLTLADVNLKEHVLCIRETKFSKTRLVPFGPNMATRLSDYITFRHNEEPLPETPLFSFCRNQAVNPGTISQTFRRLLPALSLKSAVGVATPRLHDLRHSFAVRTLLRWYREGINPNDRLIQLSTFMGHVDPNSTAVYLTITDELFSEACQRFHSLAFGKAGGTQ